MDCLDLSYMKRILLLLFIVLSLKVSAQTTAPDSTAKPSAELRYKIITESKDGGKLDTWAPIKGHEMDGQQIEPGLFASNREIAVIKWAYYVVNAGVANKAAIVGIYEELKNRKIRNDELTSLNYGYNKAINALGK